MQIPVTFPVGTGFRESKNLSMLLRGDLINAVSSFAGALWQVPTNG